MKTASLYHIVVLYCLIILSNNISNNKGSNLNQNIKTIQQVDPKSIQIALQVIKGDGKTLFKKSHFNKEYKRLFRSNLSRF